MIHLRTITLVCLTETLIHSLLLSIIAKIIIEPGLVKGTRAACVIAALGLRIKLKWGYFWQRGKFLKLSFIANRNSRSVYSETIEYILRDQGGKIPHNSWLLLPSQAPSDSVRHGDHMWTLITASNHLSLLSHSGTHTDRISCFITHNPTQALLNLLAFHWHQTKNVPGQNSFLKALSRSWKGSEGISCGFISAECRQIYGGGKKQEIQP